MAYHRPKDLRWLKGEVGHFLKIVFNLIARGIYTGHSDSYEIYKNPVYIS